MIKFCKFSAKWWLLMRCRERNCFLNGMSHRTRPWKFLSLNNDIRSRRSTLKKMLLSTASSLASDEKIIMMFEIWKKHCLDVFFERLKTIFFNYFGLFHINKIIILRKISIFLICSTDQSYSIFGIMQYTVGTPEIKVNFWPYI